MGISNASWHAPVRRALSIPEFCEAYGLSRSTVYRMMANGALPSVKIGKRRLIPVDAAEALLQKMER
ncbi:helix-turn-helix domain-containing protein [Camelimonas abortus]|uniref:Helix-turn-helix domain-containing protein n=1 Tax=Camelimonas abortus TaxID=1017184 RepID=A0ABV7LEW7_9HYPH